MRVFLILFCFLISFSLQASITSKIKDAINEIGSKPSPCTNLSGQSRAYCDKVYERKKNKIMKELVERYLQFDLATRVQEINRLNQNEAICISALRSKFDSCSWAYDGTENCMQLKLAKIQNGECNVDLGSGSGSGSQ